MSLVVPIMFVIPIRCYC